MSLLHSGPWRALGQCLDVERVMKAIGPSSRSDLQCGAKRKPCALAKIDRSGELSPKV